MQGSQQCPDSVTPAAPVVQYHEFLLEQDGKDHAMIRIGNDILGISDFI